MEPGSEDARALPAHGSRLRAAVTEQEPPPRREERARFASILLCYLRHSSRPRTPRPLFHSGIITVQFPSASSMGEDCMLRGLGPVLLVLSLTASLLPSRSFSFSRPFSLPLGHPIFLSLSLFLSRSRLFSIARAFLRLLPVSLLCLDRLSLLLLLSSAAVSVRPFSILAETRDDLVSSNTRKYYFLLGC